MPKYICYIEEDKIVIREEPVCICFKNNDDSDVTTFASVDSGFTQILFQLYLIYRGIRIACIYDYLEKEEMEEIIEAAKIMKLSRMIYGDNNIIISERKIVQLLDFFVKIGDVDNKLFLNIVRGILCGIPSCCIEKFVEYDCDIIEMAKGYLDKVKDKHDKYHIYIEDNTVYRKHIFYVPCDPDCYYTKVLYKKTLRYWMDFLDKFGVPPEHEEEIKDLVEQLDIIVSLK